MLKQAWTSTYKSYVITKRRLKTVGMTEKIKWSHADLNRRPPACHAGALPAELWPLNYLFNNKLAKQNLFNILKNIINLFL